MGLDNRIGTKFMLPGGPYSGPCLPRDNLSLKKFCLDYNIQNSFPDEVQRINNVALENIYKIISNLKNKHKIRSFGFLGLGYKSNTQCFEESYSIKMMNFIESLNIKVFYYDPYLTEKFAAKKVESLEELSLKSDIIFLSYIDQQFNPIIQVEHKKKIWDLWYSFLIQNIIKFFINYLILKNLKIKILKKIKRLFSLIKNLLNFFIIIEKLIIQI